MSCQHYRPQEIPVPQPVFQSREMGRGDTGSQDSRSVASVTTDVLRVRRLRKTVRSYAEQLETSQRANPSKRKRQRLHFVTLTYRDGSPWSPRHIAEFLQRVRVWARRHGHRLAYVWCAEMHVKRFIRTGVQKPHYHVLIWLPPNLSLPRPDTRGWWPHGHTNCLRARSVGYLVKYTSKSHVPDGLAFPHGMRIFGCGGLDEDGKQVHRYTMAPAWVRERVPFGERWVRIDGGVFRPSTGEWWQCPYSVAVVRRGKRWRLEITPRMPVHTHYSNLLGQTWEIEPRIDGLEAILEAMRFREQEARWELCMEVADELVGGAL